MPQKDIPVSLKNRIVEAALDLRLRGTEIHTLAYLCVGADPSGLVGADESGSRSLCDPFVLGEYVGLAPSTVYSVLARLEKHGYIEWRRRPSQIKILLSSDQA